MSETLNTVATRIGTIVRAAHIPSLSGARDIGGCIVTRAGRIVIAAGISDGERNHPFRIVVSDNDGETVRDVFVLPAAPDVTYHTLGLTYDPALDLVIAMFGRNIGYRLSDTPFGEALPFSMNYCGANEAVVALGWNNAEIWTEDKVIPLDRPENSHGMSGHAIPWNGGWVFPHPAGTSDPTRTERRCKVYLGYVRPTRRDDGSYTCEYDHRFRTLATNEDRDAPFASETVYIEKADAGGYLSFTRNYVPGRRGCPPWRREYDADHRPVGEYHHPRVDGFDPRDYDPEYNGPMLVAFGIVRLADGNLLYASRFYETEHHRAGNIFMTSRDEGKTWQFQDDYLPWTITPLTFPFSGSGGNPQMYYEPDGRLAHLTSEGCVEQDPPRGGFYLHRLRGITIEGHHPVEPDGRGTISIDVSTISRIEDVHIGGMSVTDSAGVELADESVDRYTYSDDATRVSFDYRVVDSPAFILPRIVVANRSNPHRPVFCPRIDIGSRPQP